MLQGPFIEWYGLCLLHESPMFLHVRGYHMVGEGDGSSASHSCALEDTAVAHV